MALIFADTHNMIAYLTKSDASEGFNQIIDFMNTRSIKYALTVNPNIYVSCIKHFWTSVSVTKVNDVTRLQALVDKKRVIITEATIRDALRLDDAEGIDCLPNEEFFTELARMGYEKVGKGCSGVEIPLFKSMVVAHQVDEGDAEVNINNVSTAGVVNEGATSVTDDVVPAAVDKPSIPSPTPPTQTSQPSQDIPFTSQNLLDTCTTLTRRVENLEQDKIAQDLEITKLKQMVKKLEGRNKLKVSKLRRLKKVGTAQRVDTYDDTVMDNVSKQGRIIADMDAYVDVTLKDIAKDVAVNAKIEESTDVQGRQAESQAQIYQINLEHADKILSMQDDKVEPSELQEVVEVVTTAKLITEVVTAASATIVVAAPQLTTAVAPTLTAAPSAARRINGVVIRDPKDTATPSKIIHSEAKSKDKGKGILDEVIDQVQRKEKEDNDVMRYQALKRKPQTKAQARKNMMIYLRNVAGFKMDYFKRMNYDDIRPIFEKKFNSNVAFLQKTKEQMKEEDSRALKRISETQEEKAAKKQKLDEEVAELKRHL
nr:xylulose kinase-1 [Tanacetum cinerariifolium]